MILQKILFNTLNAIIKEIIHLALAYSSNFIMFVSTILVIYTNTILMRNIFKITIVLILVLSFQNLGNSQWLYGGGMKFNSNNDFKAVGLNAKVGKDIGEKLDANLDITYYLASKASWSFDFDVQYRLFNINDILLIRPFAGINFTRTEITNNSLSLGVSFKVPDDQYTYYMEPRWILDHQQFVFSVGALF